MLLTGMTNVYRDQGYHIQSYFKLGLNSILLWTHACSTHKIFTEWQKSSVHQLQQACVPFIVTGISFVNELSLSDSANVHILHSI